jgi:surface antigen
MPDLNQDIITFAQSNMGTVVKAKGKKVDTDKEETTLGNGGCWDFPYEALKAAKAKIPNIYKGNQYDWGQLIPIGSVRPGDIVQFKNHLATVKTVTLTGKIPYTYVKPYKRGPAHSAIVASVNSDGTIDVFEQHVSGIAGVQRNKVYLQSQKPNIAGNVTTTITVTGSFKFYHPVSEDSKKESN